MAGRFPGTSDPANIPGARYANYFEVGHNAFEFLIDFAQDEGRDDKGPLRHTRIITNPKSARVLLDLLRLSIEQYDRRYGGGSSST